MIGIAPSPPLYFQLSKQSDSDWVWAENPEVDFVSALQNTLPNILQAHKIIIYCQ